MLKHRDHFHGSDLEAIEAAYGIKKEDIISFSANVNPLGLSSKLRTELSEHLDVITSYPDREYTALRKVISEYASCRPENVMVGNGSTELISLFIQAIAPKKAMILGPTYSEYEREISLGGGSSLYFPLREENDFILDEKDLIDSLNDSIDLLVVCNPNNPTSGAITRKVLRHILDACKRFDIYVMVDETYVEFAEAYDEINSVPLADIYNNIVILRGISKFFASPGLRLGYAIAGDTELIRKINSHKNPWTINSLAEAAGKLMFTDTDYINATKELIFTERRRVADALRSMDSLKVYEPAANFVLCRILRDDVNADMLFDATIKKGLMIRNCMTFPFLDNSYFRICFMNPADNDRLLECIAKTLL